MVVCAGRINEARGTVLLVEDEAVVLDVGSAMLAELG